MMIIKILQVLLLLGVTSSIELSDGTLDDNADKVCSDTDCDHKYEELYE